MWIYYYLGQFIRLILPRITTSHFGAKSIACSGHSRSFAHFVSVLPICYSFGRVLCILPLACMPRSTQNIPQQLHGTCHSMMTMMSMAMISMPLAFSLSSSCGCIGDAKCGGNEKSGRIAKEVAQASTSRQKSGRPGIKPLAFAVHVVACQFHLFRNIFFPQLFSSLFCVCFLSAWSQLFCVNGTTSSTPLATPREHRRYYVGPFVILFCSLFCSTTSANLHWMTTALNVWAFTRCWIEWEGGARESGYFKFVK